MFWCYQNKTNMSRGSRSTYWSNSKFSKWIQETFANTTKPYALPLGQWSKWNKALQTAHPLVYWFTEDFLNWAQNVVNYPKDVLDDVRYWGYNRFVSKPHVLDTKLEKGKYHEIDTRILRGLFETLVDFIEVEKAWMTVVWDEEARKTYHLPWYKRVPYWMRWVEWRCPEAGLHHLQWEMSLIVDYEWLPEDERASQPHYGEPTPQALSAKEQYELYNWWKNIRPTRPDPMDAGGWSEYRAKMDAKHGEGIMSWMDDRDEEDNTASKIALDNTTKIEELYHKEDEEMMIRLIKVRGSLWT